MTIRIKPWVAASLLGAAMVVSGSVALAEEQTVYRFDLPAQPLAEALRAIARQTGANVLFESKDLSGIRAKELKGQLTTSEAIQRVLEGTKLEAQRTTPTTVIVQPTPADSSARAASANPYEGVRLAQSAPSPSQEEGRGEDREEADEVTTGEDGQPQIQKRVEVEAIIVTGTRIRGANSGGSPVVALDRDDIEQSGAASVQQLLRTLPQNFTGGITETATSVASARNGAGGNNLGYGNGVNLRGLGNESTLILLNGRRMAPAGLGAFVDVSTIPLGALARVEVVADGASAIYGSDAVGGVVNFVLREDFQGSETRARYASVTDGSLRQFSLNQLLGTSWGSGAVLANFDYGRNEPLFATERPFATGLQTGTTYLSPSDERMGILVNAHQDLSEALTLSLLTHGNVRDAENLNYVSLANQQYQLRGETKQFGGVLELNWEVSEDWAVTLAHTEAFNESSRVNRFLATATAPETGNQVHARHDVSATELEVEGALFDLPGGAVRLAIGAEHREEDLRLRRVNFPRGPRIQLDRDVSSAYAEIFSPLIGPGNELAFANRLNLTLATRYEDYSDVGEAETWKIGAVYEPIAGVSLRSTYGTSFRAPYLYQFDSSLGAGILINLPNPSASTGRTLTATISNVPDPSLGPENASTWSAGFDISPDVLWGVRLSATYFSIDYEDRIAAAALRTTMFIDPVLAPLIAMPPDQAILAQIAALPVFTNLTTSPLSAAQATYDARIRNQASTEVSGIDLTLEKAFDTSFGHFAVGASASYLNAFEVAQIAGATSVDISDTIYNPVDLRARAYLSWLSGPWTVSTFVNYTDEYTDNQIRTAPIEVPSWTTLDLTVSYRFGENNPWLRGLTLRANAMNVLDEDPPAIIDRASSYGNPGYDTENASPLGRMLSVEIVKTW